MDRSNVSRIKKERKKALFLRKISELLQALAGEDSVVSRVFVTRVDLSADTGICYVYFASYPDETGQTAQEVFDEALEALKLYKPSMRTALAKTLHGRYVPNLVFLFDENKEKVDRINELLNKVQDEKSSNDNSDDEE